MLLNEEQLAQVKEMAKVFLLPREIALILEVDVDAFVAACNDQRTAVYRSYQGGRLLSVFELRKNVLQLANSGSSPAQTMALELLRESEMKMLDR